MWNTFQLLFCSCCPNFLDFLHLVFSRLEVCFELFSLSICLVCMHTLVFNVWFNLCGDQTLWNTSLSNAEKWKRQLNSVIQAVVQHGCPAYEDFGLLMFQILNLLKEGNHAFFVRQWKRECKLVFYK